ncbi:hypothetical protein TEA_028774 [Camellia sinensis var. sinensis]|uniref:Uncharacterized protein n=1 Tax=Camellia sinensis var. sinensis TaxID=542762 RepID=A0A4S4EJ40_CAMSN|nr:hypothetical protein TEA_028774 [Camellia sinensis var. sinensis]
MSPTKLQQKDASRIDIKLERHLHKGSTSFTLVGSFCTLSFDNFFATSLKEDALYSLARRPPFPTLTNQNAKEPSPLHQEVTISISIIFLFKDNLRPSHLKSYVTRTLCIFRATKEEEEKRNMARDLIVIVVRHLCLLYSSLLMVAKVSIFVLLGIVVAGAALGYWMVQKFVISDDGSVDVGAAQFEKWAMHIIAATFIFQVAILFITLDTPLAMGASASCLSICFLVTSFKWNGQSKLPVPFFPYSPLASCWQTVQMGGLLDLIYECSTITFGNSIYSANGNPWRSRGRANVRHNRAEFLSRSGMVASRGTLWNSPRRSSGWSDSPVKGHPTERSFQKKSGRISPKNQPDMLWLSWHPLQSSLIGLLSMLTADDNSDNTIGSGSDSPYENLVESGD